MLVNRSLSKKFGLFFNYTKSGTLKNLTKILKPNHSAKNVNIKENSGKHLV